MQTMAGTDVKDKTLYQSLQNWDDFKYWLSENKLQALGNDSASCVSSPTPAVCSVACTGSVHCALWCHIQALLTLTFGLVIVGSAWLGAVGVSFAAQMYQDTPITLKIFQTRIYAQAVTLGALCGAAYITLSEDKKKKEVSSCFWPLQARYNLGL